MADDTHRRPPKVSRLRAFVETRELLNDVVGVLSRHVESKGGVFYYYLGGFKKVLVVTDPEAFRRIFKDNFENYPKSDFQIESLGQFLGPGLLTSHGDPWRHKRRLIQQAFDAGRLATMADGMYDALALCLAGFDERIVRGPVEIGAEFTRMALSMIAQSMFSTRLADGEMQSISDGIDAIQTFIFRQIVKQSLSPWSALSGELRKLQQIRERADQILLRHIRARRARPADGDDLLRILLEAGLDDDGERMTDGDILCESMQILVAGHETSSTALSWALYLLARNPETLRKARAEMAAVIGDGPPRSCHLADLPLTTCIIDETLRLYPPFWAVDRRALKDDHLGGLSIPAGTTLIAFIHGAQHQAAHWTAPACFMPERFLAEGKAARAALRHLPFGAGPRRCIGANYAMLQMVMILNAVLRDYHFELADRRPVQSKPRILQRPRHGLWLRFERRS
ncbi:cytochrome P450 [Bradyrhizobium sp.]